MIFRNIRKRSKLFSIVFSVIILLCPADPAMVFACAFPSTEQEEGRFMLFNPNLLQNDAWWTYFYNDKYLYLDGFVQAADDEALLTREWLDYLKLSLDDSVAHQALFGSLPDSTLAQNTFYQAIQKHDDVKKYFEFARQCERLASQPAPWDDDQIALQVAGQRSKMLPVLQGALQHAAGDFLTRKYAFQIVKLAYYANDSLLFNTIYHRYFQRSKASVLDWWAKHYKSMMLERSGLTDSANYLHALVFSHSTNKMLASRQYFSRQDLPGVLALAQDDHERADILLLSEVIHPGQSLEGIRGVYQYHAKHPHLPLLIGREINKLEDWLSSTRYAGRLPITGDYWNEGPVMENWKSDFQYLKTFTTEMSRMHGLARQQPVFYNAAMAYLNLMKGDGKVAKRYLDQLDTASTDTRYQVNLLKTVYTVQTENISTDAVQEKIGSLLQSLIDERKGNFESQKMLYSLSSYLRYAFQQKGMNGLAGLFDNYAHNKFCYTCDDSSFEYSLVRFFDLHASIADVKTVIALYDRRQKNTLEEILMKPYAHKYFFYDVLSVKYLREYNVKGALEALNNIPDDFWYTYSNAAYALDRDPFFDNEALLDVQTLRTYNKREVVQMMDDLEGEASRDPATRNRNYFLLGNAWYNFSRHSWFMVSYGWTEGTTTNPQHATSAGNRALHYYQRALQLERDMEQRAKLAFMLAELSRGDTLKAYAKAYERYRGTEFYRNRNCLTLSDLAGRN